MSAPPHATPSSDAIDVVHIDLGDRSYDILIGERLDQQVARWPHWPKASTAVLVSNPTVAALHAPAWLAALKTRYARVLSVELPDGEAHKDWASLDTLFSTLLREACDRRTTLFALGGGVIGDTTGFAAACYMRGVPFVQIPTSLLAQVDSSVGGKTAINHPLGKNMIGAFYQPQTVLCDLSTLATLPEREYRSGLAEVIKYGPIADADFLVWLEANMPALLAREPVALRHAVKRSCEIKAAVVGGDERDHGLRATLNFGHTFGHAIEAAQGYGRWLHGEAVAVGMVMAAALSAKLGLMPEDFVSRLVRLIAAAGLPTYAPSMPWATWSQWMRVDKKAEGGAIQYIVIESLGRATLRAVPDELVAPIVEAWSKPA
jgi:3-dehydroquinate synthase